MIILDTVAVRGSTSTIKIAIRKSEILENPLRPGEPAQLGKGNEEIVISVLYGDADKMLEIEKVLERKGRQNINNMYQEDGSKEKWVCPGCKKEGRRINKYMGQCKQPGCVAIAPDNTYKDISKKNKRKMEALIIDKREEIQCNAHTFWTDGSGKKIPGGGEMMKTGWATVQGKGDTATTTSMERRE